MSAKSFKDGREAVLGFTIIGDMDNDGIPSPDTTRMYASCNPPSGPIAEWWNELVGRMLLSVVSSCVHQNDTVTAKCLAYTAHNLRYRNKSHGANPSDEISALAAFHGVTPEEMAP